MAKNNKPKGVLTRREAGIFKRFALDARTYKEISEELWISRSTVVSHLYHARIKLRGLGLKTRAEFTIF